MDVGVNGIQLSASRAATASPNERRQMLRQAASEVVGSVFFAPMLKMARDNPWKGKYGHGGRGEEVFGAQLDMELARRASHRLDGGLIDAVVKGLGRRGSQAAVSGVQTAEATSTQASILSGTD